MDFTRERFECRWNGIRRDRCLLERHGICRCGCSVLMPSMPGSHPPSGSRVTWSRPSSVSTSVAEEARTDGEDRPKVGAVKVLVARACAAADQAVRRRNPVSDRPNGRHLTRADCTANRRLFSPGALSDHLDLTFACTLIASPDEGTPLIIVNSTGDGLRHPCCLAANRQSAITTNHPQWTIRNRFRPATDPSFRRQRAALHILSDRRPLRRRFGPDDYIRWLGQRTVGG